MWVTVEYDSDVMKIKVLDEETGLSLIKAATQTA
jgi:hypothetical protein